MGSLQELRALVSFPPYIENIIDNDKYTTYITPEVYMAILNEEFERGIVDNNILPCSDCNFSTYQTSSFKYREQVYVSTKWVIMVLYINGYNIYTTHVEITNIKEWKQIKSDTFTLYYKFNDDGKLITVLV